MLQTTNPVLVLWDVDHTLIENGGVSKGNYALAFELLTGRAPTVQAGTDGRTDVGIMGELLTSNGVDSDAYGVAEQLAALVDAGERNRTLLAERGHAMPGAAECLVRLKNDPSVVQSLLTGNVEPNARVKLETFGLDKWLDWSVGAFGQEHNVRGRLVPVAQAKAVRVFGFNADRDVTVLVGDTTLDVAAGLIGGARVIAVATGISSVDELWASGADAVLPNLVDVDAFVDALHQVAALGPTGPRAHETLGG